MANEVQEVEKTKLVIADATDWPGGGSHGWGDDTGQIDLTSLASGSARQSDKVDFGVNAAKRASRYDVRIALEYAAAPTSGKVGDLYVYFSHSATAGIDNPGGCSGSDSAYTGTAGDSLDDSLKQLIHVGSIVLTSDATTTVQIADVGSFVAMARYGGFVFDNNGDQVLHSDAVEMAILVTPIVAEIQ